MKFTVLGSGSTGNAVLISSETTNVLVDAGLSAREILRRLNDVGVAFDDLDGVLITHEHADHTHGIDDLRPLFVRKRRQIDIYLDEPTSKSLNVRFGYCFSTPPNSGYPPILREHRLAPGKTLEIAGEGGPVPVLPVLQDHGDIPSLGFRFGNVAYSADIKDLPATSLAAMAGLDLWIVDALRYEPHPSHLNLAEALALIARVAPKRAILTNLHADLDYETLRRELPLSIEPAFDGWTVTIGSTNVR
jgi:phosphoribosyl 1,2-cyclic phosphate phosphodiesterase